MSEKRAKEKYMRIAPVVLVWSIGLVTITSLPVYATGPSTPQEWFTAGQRAVQAAKRLTKNSAPAKNVILFVGDGMGISTLTAARILAGQLRGASGEENQLSFEKFPYLALSKTYSVNQQTSDSAPTMTAPHIGRIPSLLGVRTIHKQL